MESALINVQFRLQPCERCQRPTIHALRDNFRICSGCEPAAFERAALSLVLARNHALGVARDKSLAPARDTEAGRHESLQ